MSAFQQITDSHASHRSLASWSGIFIFSENNLPNGTNDGRFYYSKSSTGKKEKHSRLSYTNNQTTIHRNLIEQKQVEKQMFTFDVRIFSLFKTSSFSCCAGLRWGTISNSRRGNILCLIKAEWKIGMRALEDGFCTILYAGHVMFKWIGRYFFYGCV